MAITKSALFTILFIFYLTSCKPRVNSSLSETEISTVADLEKYLSEDIRSFSLERAVYVRVQSLFPDSAVSKKKANNLQKKYNRYNDALFIRTLISAIHAESHYTTASSPDLEWQKTAKAKIVMRNQTYIADFTSLLKKVIAGDDGLSYSPISNINELNWHIQTERKSQSGGFLSRESKRRRGGGLLGGRHIPPSRPPEQEPGIYSVIVEALTGEREIGTDKLRSDIKSMDPATFVKKYRSLNITVEQVRLMKASLAQKKESDKKSSFPIEKNASLSKKQNDLQKKPLSQEAARFISNFKRIDRKRENMQAIDLSKLFEKPQSQGDSSACVGFTFARSIQQKLSANKSLLKVSPWTVYQQLVYLDDSNELKEFSLPSCSTLRKYDKEIASGSWDWDLGILPETTLLPPKIHRLEFCSTSDEKIKLKNFISFGFKDGTHISPEIVTSLLDLGHPVSAVISSESRTVFGRWVKFRKVGVRHAITIVGYGVGPNPFTMKAEPYYLFIDSKAKNPWVYKISKANMGDILEGVFDFQVK